MSRFVFFFSDSPSIQVYFKAIDWISETIIAKKKKKQKGKSWRTGIAIVSSGSECVPRRKWVNGLVVGFVVQEITSEILKSVVLLSRSLDSTKETHLFEINWFEK